MGFISQSLLHLIQCILPSEISAILQYLLSILDSISFFYLDVTHCTQPFSLVVIFDKNFLKYCLLAIAMLEVTFLDYLGSITCPIGFLPIVGLRLILCY